MQTSKHIIIIASLLTTLVGTSTRDAEACGGCIAPPGQFSAIDSHRMVIKLGLEESILWDQFIYSGSPEEFAWVLPVPSPATVVELADANFIDVIDQETSPRVFAPECGAYGGGCSSGCDGDFAGGQSLADGVVVHSHKLVGPYETVVIGSEDPNALYAWLGQNGYAFPAEGLGVLDYYTAKASSFVVLRLRPDVEVSAMQPVRVRFKGYMGDFPLKMISLGVFGSVDLSLWIVADERYAPTNFENRTIAAADLVWDWNDNESNYEEVFDSAIQDAGGAAWITEYSQVLDESALADELAARAPVDYELASSGMHYPVLTRLRTRLPVEALAEDLELAPSIDPTAVSRDLIAVQTLGECSVAVAAGDASSIGDERKQIIFWLLLALGGIWLRRRVTRQSTSASPRARTMLAQFANHVDEAHT